MEPTLWMQFPAKLLRFMAQNLAQWARSKGKTDEDSNLMVEGLLAPEKLAAGEASILGRLGDLGIIRGEIIQYFGRAPLGEPIYICVRETVIALRLNEARLISVSLA